MYVGIYLFIHVIGLLHSLFYPHIFCNWFESWNNIPRSNGKLISYYSCNSRTDQVLHRRNENDICITKQISNEITFKKGLASTENFVGINIINPHQFIISSLTYIWSCDVTINWKDLYSWWPRPKSNFQNILFTFSRWLKKYIHLQYNTCLKTTFTLCFGFFFWFYISENNICSRSCLGKSAKKWK